MSSNHASWYLNRISEGQSIDYFGFDVEPGPQTISNQLDTYFWKVFFSNVGFQTPDVSTFSVLFKSAYRSLYLDCCQSLTCFHVLRYIIRKSCSFLNLYLLLFPPINTHFNLNTGKWQSGLNKMMKTRIEKKARIHLKVVFKSIVEVRGKNNVLVVVCNHVVTNFLWSVSVYSSCLIFCGWVTIQSTVLALTAQENHKMFAIRASESLKTRYKLELSNVPCFSRLRPKVMLKMRLRKVRWVG